MADDTCLNRPADNYMVDHGTLDAADIDRFADVARARCVRRFSKSRSGRGCPERPGGSVPGQMRPPWPHDTKEAQHDGRADGTCRLVVDDLAGAMAFFVELGLELEGEAPVEGRWVDRVVGLKGVRADIAIMRTPDGHGRLELAKFHTPPGRGGDARAPANALGIRHILFAVQGIDDVLDRLRTLGAELVGELEQYESSYRPCYVRGPEGIIIELAEQSQ